MQELKKNYIDFYRSEGRYNLLNSSEVSGRYVITGIDREIIKEKDLSVSFLVDLEFDCNFNPDDYTVMELLDELEYIYENKYLWNSRLKDIKPLREYLESIQEEQEKLRQKYKIDYARYKIEHWTKELEKLS